MFVKYSTIRYDTIRYDKILYDKILYDTIRYDATRYDTTRLSYSECENQISIVHTCIDAEQSATKITSGMSLSEFQDKSG